MDATSLLVLDNELLDTGAFREGHLEGGREIDAGGKQGRKRSGGWLFDGHVYVAQIAMGASAQQTWPPCSRPRSARKAPFNRLAYIMHRAPA